MTNNPEVKDGGGRELCDMVRESEQIATLLDRMCLNGPWLEALRGVVLFLARAEIRRLKADVLEARKK